MIHHPHNRSFGEMLDRGIKYLGTVTQEIESGGASVDKVIPGKKAFYLYDTLGFPVDLTQLMAAEKGFVIDLQGFTKEMEEQKARSREAALRQKAGGSSKPLLLQVDETALLQKENVARTDDDGKYTWDHSPEAKILRIFGYDGFSSEVSGPTPSDALVGILLDKTAFYAESGGQVADSGILRLASGDEFEVIDVQTFAGYILHIGRLTSGAKLSVGETVKCEVDYRRRSKVAPNHTMTHVMNYALRKVLGPNVDQKGSLVNEEKLRFDFSHGSSLSAEQIGQVEEIVQDMINRRLPVSAKVSRSIDPSFI